MNEVVSVIKNIGIPLVAIIFIVAVMFIYRNAREVRLINLQIQIAKKELET